jgi:Ca2+/Na+ antiporter
MGIFQKKPKEDKTSIHWKRFLYLVLILFLMALVHDLMLSPLVFLAGILILLWFNFQQKQQQRAQINEDAESVALQLRSLIHVDHSIIHALQQVELPDGLLKSAISELRQRLSMQQAPMQAAQALKGIPGSFSNRLFALIANTAHLNDAIQDDLLLAIEKEAQRQKSLRNKMQQTLTLVKGTIRLLQGVVVGAVLFVMLTPTWRSFFLQDGSHRILLFFLIILVLLASAYFEYEVHQLRFGER